MRYGKMVEVLPFGSVTAPVGVVLSTERNTVKRFVSGAMIALVAALAVMMGAVSPAAAQRVSETDPAPNGGYGYSISVTKSSAPSHDQRCSISSISAAEIDSCIYSISGGDRTEGGYAGSLLPPDVFASGDCTGRVAVGVVNPNAEPVKYLVVAHREVQKAEVTGNEQRWFDFEAKHPLGSTVRIAVAWDEGSKLAGVVRMNVTLPTAEMCGGSPRSHSIS